MANSAAQSGRSGSGRVGANGGIALLITLLLIVLSGGVSLLIALLWFLLAARAFPTEVSNCDCYLVPGKRLRQGVPDEEFRQRLQAVFRLWLSHPATILLSGGVTGREAGEAQFGHAGISEARAAMDVLATLGVEPDDMVLEESALHSYENLLFARPLLAGKRHIAIVSSRYHLPRLMLIAAEFKLPVSAIAAQPRLPLNGSMLLRCGVEAFYCHWYAVALMLRACRVSFND